jgi:hypothetical protein
MTIASLPRAALPALLAALALAACQRERLSADEHAARTAVLRYNEALVLAYRSGNVGVLRDAAVPVELERVDGIIRSLAAEGKYLEARPPEIRFLFTTVNPRPDTVTLVNTIETWTYEHRSLAARDAPAPSRRAKYRLEYDLVRKDGGFVVNRIVEHELPANEPPP